MMKFETWLKKQKKRDDPIGDLANDFECAKQSYPEKGTLCNEEHLFRWDAIDDAYQALKDARKEYEQYCHNSESIIDIKNALIKRLTDTVAELEAAMPRWISVKDRLPDESYDTQIFLGCFFARAYPDQDKLYVRELCFNRDSQEWYCDDEIITAYLWEIIYWMPLPSPPESE